MSDDITGQFLNTRERVTSSQLIQDLEAKYGEPEQPIEQPEVQPVEPVEEPEEEKGTSVKGVVKDVAGGIIEAPGQIAGGVSDAINATINAAEDFFDWQEAVDLGKITFADGEFQGVLSKEELAQLEFDRGEKFQPLQIPTTHDPRTTTGGVVRGVSQFLTGFLTAGKIKPLQALAKGTKGQQLTGAMAKGALSDALAFEGDEGRLSDLIQSHPDLQNPVTEFLSTDPDDNEAEGRFKNALEGLGLGTLAEGFFKSVRLIRNSKKTKVKVDEQTPAPKVKEEKAEPIEVLLGDKKKGLVSVDRPKAGEEAAANINLSKIETDADVKEAIEQAAKLDHIKINEARREVQTEEITARLADDLGMTVNDLLERQAGQAFNAEQLLASRQILVSSGEQLKTLAQNAVEGGQRELIAFQRGQQIHLAIQRQVSGLTAEAGRALQQFKVIAKGKIEQSRAIGDVIQAAGGEGDMRAMARMISDMETPAQLNTFVDQASKASTKDMFFEAWINGLLSSPATHVVNTVSNAVVAGWSVGERKVANLIGKGLGEENISSKEVQAQMYGLVEGARDGARLAWKAFKSGEPSDPLTKLETQKHKAITAENLELSGMAGRTADYLGEFIRIPGRLLTTGDEFFKTMGYRMELNAQAMRQALGEGLDGRELAERVTQITKNPPENIHLAAIDAGRYQTFTKPLGEAGQAIQGVQQKFAPAKIIMPFIRTPVNIMKFVGEKTPLAPLSKAVREEIAAGGARKDLALAKIATGSTFMMIAADHAMQGDITGAGPSDPRMKRALRETGWQPYSVRVGDDYFSYSRLDPIGAFLGLSADITEIIGQSSESDAVDMAMASSIAIAQNVSSKTYLRGVTEFFDAVASAKGDPEAGNPRMRRWVARLAGSVVPSGVAGLEREGDPTLRSTQALGGAQKIINAVRSRIPGYSEGLPPRLNMWGEPIVLSGGLGPDMMSPVYTSSLKHDVVDDEIVKIGLPLSMPGKYIQGVELDGEEFNRYVELSAGIGLPGGLGELKPLLEKTMSTSSYIRQTDGADGGKALIIRTMVNNYRQVAREQMKIEFPELKMRIDQELFEKQEALGL